VYGYMMLKCTCGGILKRATLKDFDFRAFAGIPSTLHDARGFRCEACGGETIPGDVINDALRSLVFAIVQMKQLLPGDLARFLRRRLRLSQQEIADRMNVNRVTVADWERGAAAISPQHDFTLRGLVVARAMAEARSPSRAECAAWAEVLGAVRQAPGIAPPFVIEHARKRKTRAARSRAA
jgi:DNA-binding transcriptional regulator YiaG